MFNSNEPLGLPKGSIRALITLAFTGVTAYVFATGGTPGIELMTIDTVVILSYFNNRVTEPTREEPLAKALVVVDDEA